MSFELPSLPYDASALEPHLSRKTLRVHHDILQKNYVQTLNRLVQGTPYDQLPLEQIIMDAPEGSDIFENAAQAWNHTFLWFSMRPKGGGRPSSRSGFGRALSAYGSHTTFKKAFKETSKELFGSGWLWLAADPHGHVHLWLGKDADNPMRYGYRPLLVLDLWEHAFTLDYPGKRAEYVDAFLNHLVNWNFAEANYKRAFGL